MIPAPISTHPSRPRRRRFAVRRWPGWLMWLSLLSVGADAHIGPLLGITCVAPVGRGDHTPPSVHSRSPRRGRAPSRPMAEASTQDGLVGCGNFSPPRRGGPMCPPGHASAQNTPTGRHTGRPLQILLRPPSTPRQRAGTEPRPYRFDCSLHQPRKTGCLSAKPANQFSILNSPPPPILPRVGLQYILDN